MKTPWANLEGYPRAIVASVCILLLSGGLCGVQLAIANLPNVPSALAPLAMITGALEISGILGSALVLAFCLIAWPISAWLQHKSRLQQELEARQLRDAQQSIRDREGGQ